MPKFKIALEVQRHSRVVIEVEADSACDAEDRATDLFYQDDGCHRIRENMEPTRNVVDVRLAPEQSEEATLAFSADYTFPEA